MIIRVPVSLSRHKLGGRGGTSAKCSGINCALRLDDGALEIRERLFRRRTRTVQIGRVESIELLRKTVMPPLVIGVIGLSAALLLATSLWGLWVAVLPQEFHAFLQLSGFGIALICLFLLVARVFFANLILKPADSLPIVVRLVPIASAKRFFALLQRQIPIYRGV
jgi:hypothetical protein